MLAKSINDAKSLPQDTPHSARYFREGFVVFNEKGTVGKLCTENLNETLPSKDVEMVLQTVATSLCSILSFT